MYQSTERERERTDDEGLETIISYEFLIQEMY